jgi:inorganic pyrophosphatase
MNSTFWIGKQVHLHIDRPAGSRHPEHGFLYPINYGYLPGTQAADGEELDAYLLGVSEPLDCFSGECVAVLHRLNDDDDKLIVVPPGMQVSDAEIRRQTDFVEQFFESVILRSS